MVSLTCDDFCNGLLVEAGRRQQPEGRERGSLQRMAEPPARQVVQLWWPTFAPCARHVDTATMTHYSAAERGDANGWKIGPALICAMVESSISSRSAVRASGGQAVREYTAASGQPKTSLTSVFIKPS